MSTARNPDDHDVVAVFGWRATEVPTPIPGSEIRHCNHCGEQVMLAPTSLALFDRYPIVAVFCNRCAANQLDQHPVDDVTIEAPPGAHVDPVAELHRMLTHE